MNGSPSNISSSDSMEIDEKEHLTPGHPMGQTSLLSCTNEQFDATLDHLFNL